MSKQIICNICLTNGNIIKMKAMDGYFKCPECENEVWPDRDGRFVANWQEQQYLNQKYRSCSLPEGVKVQGGGDPSGKLPGGENKKTTQMLYNQLFKQT